MTIIEKSSWSGLNINDVRPYRRVRMLQQLKTIAEDLAYAYKAGTGVAVPGAPGSDVAADHVHDGTDGAVIPLPFFHACLGAQLNASTTASGGWQPFFRQVFYAPTGQDRIRVRVFTRNPFALTANGLRCVVRSVSAGLPVTAEVTTWATDDAGGAGLFDVNGEVSISAPALNVVEVSAWSGANGIGGLPIVGRDVVAVLGVPAIGQPFTAYSYRDSSTASGQVKTPSASQYLGANAFTSFDDAMFTDGRAVASWLVQGLNKNFAYLWERMTGLPLPLNGSSHTNDVRWRGHAHAGDTAASTASANLGAEIEHALGAWYHGVGLRPNDVANYLTVDQVSADDDTWTGRIHAPTLEESTTGSDETVAEHFVRLPKGQTAGYAASGRLRAAALVYADFSKAGTTTVTFTMLNSSGSSAGTSATATVTAGGPAWQVVQVSGLDASGTGSGQERQKLRVAIKQASAPSGETTALGSVCLWAA